MASATDYHRTPSTVSADTSLVDNLNPFYTRFEACNNTVNGTVAEAVSLCDRAHCEEGSDEGETRKAAGPADQPAKSSNRRTVKRLTSMAYM